MSEKVILVNDKDEWVGLADKMEAHKQGLLHRAFSVFIFNKDGDMLIHKRAKDKYHSGGLWTNACCSHPRYGESTLSAAHRRLNEELGMDCHLDKAFTHRYKLEVGDDLTEHEYDHVYIGEYDNELKINPTEVEDYEYISVDKLLYKIESEPDIFTSWFKSLLPTVLHHLSETRQEAA